MSHFVHLCMRAKDEFLTALDQQETERNAWLAAEIKAAQTLQKMYRGKKRYHTYKDSQKNIRKIQRFLRGHFARSRWTALLRRRFLLQEKMVFDFYAEQIQKSFRGFYSRRYKHDYSARKHYIQTVVEKGKELQAVLAKYNADRNRFNENQRKEKYAKEFKKVTTGLHHLVSTKSRPGIYNNPYVESKPQIGGVNVEEHLRFAVKEYLENHKLTRKKYKPQRVRNRQSVLCSTGYDEEHQRKMMDKKLWKLKRLSSKPFVAGVPLKDKQRWKATPMSVGEPFIEQYKIQMTTKELMDRSKEGRVSDKPFVFAAPKDKLFDDYYDMPRR